MMANTYRQWRTEPRAPSVSGAPGACGRMAPSTSSPSAAPAAAAVRSCGQVEPGHAQEQLAAEALAGFRVESVCRVGGGTEAPWPQDALSWLSGEAIS